MQYWNGLFTLLRYGTFDRKEDWSIAFWKGQRDVDWEIQEVFTCVPDEFVQHKFDNHLYSRLIFRWCVVVYSRCMSDLTALMYKLIDHLSISLS